MKKEQKEHLVTELRESLGTANLMVVADYRGLDVEKISVLRRSCRKSGARLQVIKNTLAKKAIPETPFAGISAFLQGPTAITIGSGDPVSLLKVLTGFAKENESFKIKGGVISGNVFSSEQLGRIATLPSREVLLAKMLGSLTAPLTRMVGTLGNPLRGLVGILNAYKEKKGA